LNSFWKLFPVLCAVLLGAPLFAQETPYFVTYSHHLEEPGNLEIEWNNTVGLQRGAAPAFWAPFGELEYGVKTWWTTELYLEGQRHSGDSMIFTGWRLENRFRLLQREHAINPVLYFEFEDVNEGSRTMKEVVGHAEPLDEPNSELRREKERALETKLILSSNTHDWNISENFIVEKNLSENEGFEFGYALGVSRPLATLASPNPCRLCRENFTAGLELYGGLGSTDRFGFRDTAHYLAPVISWRFAGNSSLGFSPAFGLTHASSPVLFRLSYAYEIEGFRNRVASIFGSIR